MLNEETRLTARDGANGTAYYKKCFVGKCSGFLNNSFRCKNCNEDAIRCEALCKYEELKFTPEELTLIMKMYDGACEQIDKLVAENERLKLKLGASYEKIKQLERGGKD